MFALLKQPRWIALATIVGVIALLFVNLGMWQFRRLDEQRFDNQIQSERRGAASVRLAVAVDQNGDLTTAGEEHDGRRLSATGTFDPSEEVLLRSRTYNGEAGFHVITPLVLDNGAAILVNRGWVPLGFDTVPLTGRGAAPEGLVELSGYGEPSATQPRFGPTDAPGDLSIFARADIGRLSEQIDYPLYPILLVSQEDTAVPIPVELEPLEDGPHLAYAIQWFAFAVISVGGFGALLRSTARKAEERRRRAESAPTDQPAQV